MIFFYICIHFYGLYMAFIRRNDRKQVERGSDMQQGPQTGTGTQGRCSEDKASVNGTPALPTELNSPPSI